MSQQRNLRQRIQDIRTHWGQIQSGELQFSSNRLATLPRTRSSNHENDDLNAIVTANPSSSVAGNDIAQAWAMMEQARGLRGDRIAPVVPEPEISRNRETATVPTRNEGAAHLAQRNTIRGRQARLDNTREGSERESIVSRSSRQGSSGVDPDVEATYLRELRISREGSAGAHIRSSHEREGRRFADFDRERGRSADYERERGRSADFQKERQRGRSADHKEREVGRSADHERERDNSRKRSGKRTPREEEKHSHPLVGLSGREGKDVKDQFLHMVKMELKPLFQLGHIGTPLTNLHIPFTLGLTPRNHKFTL